MSGEQSVVGQSDVAADMFAPHVPMLIVGLACFASNISVRAIDPMLPVIAGQFSVNLHRAAWLFTAFSLPYALAPPILGPIADAFGKSLVMKISAVLLPVSFAACAMAPSFAALMVARAFSGVVAAGILPVAFAMIGDRVPFAQRQVSISRLVIAGITGQMGGAVLAGLLAHFGGWRSVFILSMVFAAGTAAAVLWRLHERGDTRRTFSFAAASADYVFLLTDRRALIVYATVLCEGLFVFGVFPFVAPTLLERGEGGTLIAGLSIAAYAMGGLLYGLTAHYMVDRLGPWRMMSVGAIIVGICYCVVASPVSWIAVAVLFAIAGYGFYLLHNTMQTYGTELSTRARGAAVALFALFFFVGQGLGPVLFGQISAALGYGAMFLVSAALTGLLGIVSSQLMRRHATDGSGRQNAL